MFRETKAHNEAPARMSISLCAIIQALGLMKSVDRAETTNSLTEPRQVVFCSWSSSKYNQMVDYPENKCFLSIWSFSVIVTHGHY